MRQLAFGLCLAACVLSDSTGVGGAEPSVLLQTVSLADWGIAEVGAVRFGQVALVARGADSTVELRRLADRMPLPPPLSVRGATPAFAGNNLIVADFGQGNRTALGGYFSTFQRTPSTASAKIATTPTGISALQLDCNNQEQGFCGAWVQLYDFEAPPNERLYLDASPFNMLSLWVRGHRGDEQLLIKLADAEWEQREDAVSLGHLTDYLPAGRVDTTWQQAVVPLANLPRQLRRETLALLVLEATALGSTVVDLGPIGFSRMTDPLPPLPEVAPGDHSLEPRNKATWIWNTAELLDDRQQRSQLLTFLERERFDHVFLQIPGVPDAAVAPGELTIDAGPLRLFVTALNALGIRVYALDGDPRYALPQYHAGVLATVDHVIRYNNQVQRHERFYGVRQDIEPYVLPGFAGLRRDSLLTGLLVVTAASAARARSAGLEYGADIPFWYDAPADYTYEQVTVEFDGVVKPVSEHMIDLVDDVAIMDYRTKAFGADGTVRHVTGELEYAQARDKPLFVGLETGELPDEVLLDFRGEQTRGLAHGVPEEAFVVLAPYGDSAVVLYVQEQVGRDSTIMSTIRRVLADRALDPDTFWWWPVSRRIEVPADKITFARSSASHLDLVMQQTANALQRYTSFAGFAIHHEESYRELRANAAGNR